MRKVILLMDYSSEHDRKLLRGMMRYSKENGPWMFYRPSAAIRFGENLEDWAVNWARNWNADAIIGRWDESKLHLLEDLGIPVILQNNRSRSDVFSNLTGDYYGTGKIAADYFKEKHFSDYAFFGIKDIIWSEERCKGYKAQVEALGGNFYSFMEDGETDFHESLLTWLESLPKPVALFCCDDAHAMLITELCRIHGISIPAQVAVLGVDDDELLCEISDPTISSVRMDVENGGYLACRFLDEYFNSKESETFNISIKPLFINERASTMVHNIADRHVLDLVNYIDEHFTEDLHIQTLLQMVPLSRRSIEVRFKKALNVTIYQYLLRVRIARMAELLVTTDLPYADIVYQVGFSDISNVSRIFKRYKGCSPTEYRSCYCVI